MTVENRALRDSSGLLFKNDNKSSDQHPDYKGSIMVGGVEYWLSAWIKQGKNGKFMGLATSPKDASYAPGKAVPKSGTNDMDSDIPF
jgi:hypothetical protein